jgi:AcrR family transcriptional regulator
VIPSQRRAQVSAEAILVAAEQLLHEVGFSRMTTNRIAARAGVNVALVYRYFAGKEAIVAALIERVTQATRDSFEAALLEHANPPLPVMIRALIEALASTPVSPELHRELYEQIDLTKRRALVRTQTAAMTQAVSSLLAQRRSESRALGDPTATLFVLEHAIFAATHAASFYRPDDLSRERVIDALTDLVCRTLLPVQ